MQCSSTVVVLMMLIMMTVIRDVDENGSLDDVDDEQFGLWHWLS